MPRWRASATEEGTASIEFIFVGVILLVPIAYLVITLGVVQAHTMGAETTARITARIVAEASQDDDLLALAADVSQSIAAEYDLDPAQTTVSVTCAGPGQCPAPGATLIVRVRTVVTLPFVPALFGLDRVAAIPIEATIVQKLSRVWGDG